MRAASSPANVMMDLQFAANHCRALQVPVAKTTTVPATNVRQAMKPQYRHPVVSAKQSVMKRQHVNQEVFVSRVANAAFAFRHATWMPHVETAGVVAYASSKLMAPRTAL